jgi:superfamily I DNA/RNA helicase
MDTEKIFYNGSFESYEFDILKDINFLREGERNKILNSFIRKFESYTKLEEYVSAAQDIATQVRIEVEKKYQSFVHNIFERMRLSQAHSEREADIVITTAHKVKGQEYGAVKLLNDFVCLEDVLERVEKTTKDPVKNPPVVLSREEFQLVYVAITRSFNSLELPDEYKLNADIIAAFKRCVKKKQIIFE